MESISAVSAAVLLFLVMDPVGNVSFFLAILSSVERERQRTIILREMLIALGVLVAILFLGGPILSLFGISEPALSISGGIILFLIALRMIFSDPDKIFSSGPDGEPFIVPLAIPLIAGPSTMATLLLLMAQAPSRWLQWLIALLCAWLVSCIILLFAPTISRLLGKRGAMAIERLMGMLLTTLAVQMFLEGYLGLMR